MSKSYLGIAIRTNNPEWMNEDSEDLVKGYYTKGEETISEAFARAAVGFCFGDYALAQRIYDYIYKGWFMFSSPILSNAQAVEWKFKVKPFFGTRFSRNSKWLATLPKPKGLPISCFLTYVPDTIEGQFSAAEELCRLSVAGGGVGQHLKMRGITDKSPGAIPYSKTSDANILYYKQGKTRKGAVAMYLDISHPDVIEFINIRKPTGGDPNRKSFNVHNAVNITYEFLEAVANDWMWDLVDPNSHEVTETVKARELWESILDTRYKTGEPFINNIDEANDKMPMALKALGLTINGSNLCNEIHLPTNEERTAVCCLSSVNLEYYDDWKDSKLVPDLIRFLDNVLEYFIIMSSDSLSKAKYSAMRSRDLGLGAMGWHSYLQRNDIAFESGGFKSAVQLTNIIFNNIKTKAVQESVKLAKERGSCPDWEGRRNCHLLAVAPNANSSTIIGTSPSIEPYKANAYVHRTRLGTRIVKNPQLEKLLKLRLKTVEAIEEAWDSIVVAQGSCQHLDCLTPHEKKVFRTFNEIDQRYVVVQGRHRQVYLCQGQSLNLSFFAGADKAYVNEVHTLAFDPHHEGGVPCKGLYYLRTESLSKGENVSKSVEREALVDFVEESAGSEEPDCLECQG
ncbi:ribonucleotide-diposhypothetical proteinate reductase protein, subunit alpha [Pseudoalteromonas phage vB_PtuP_Slicky01]|nr:ribonucleotide-diposhypothetical proteinate reductase protein, subunit alpha [Pseudoalteromonas phage vB_PtuP_Slicky01]